MFDPVTDRAYQNGAFIPEAEAYPPRWAAQALAFRQARITQGRARLDLPYGVGERQVFDLFLPPGRPQGLMIFVHGGYWRAFSKSDWSHLAAGALARGWAVAMPSYTLCPAGTIPAITSEIARAISAAAAEIEGQIVLTGHSAGGHLVARMLCADAGLPKAVSARIARVVPISGVFDLRPLIETAMNSDLQLELRIARAESPALLPKPHSAEVVLWVGAEERPAFLEQTRRLSHTWKTPQQIAAGRHHFDVIDALEYPESPLMRCLMPAGA